MKWARASLADVAPAERANRAFALDEVVWHLNLDQIESQTGRILVKQRAPVSSAGNSTFVFDENNVLYSKLRPYLNKVVHPDEPGIGTTELLPLRPCPGVLEADFLKFYLRSGRFVAFANSVVAGAKMPRMIMDKFWEHVIPLPAPKEQRRIVELLEQADGLRRKRTEADALAERILPALFLKMFGDPATNPKGWPTTTLDQATEITTGNTPSREDPENFGGKMPWARPADLETALPLLHTAENISEKGSLVARIVPAGSVLVCCIGATLGKVGLAGTEVAINQQINALVPSAKATPEFVYSFCLLNARSFMAAATQATLPILNKSRFGQQLIILPPLDRQRKFSGLAQVVIRQRPAQEQARQNLERIFATMLHRAFTGELTAKWREAHLKELLAEIEQQARLLKSPLVE